MPSSSRGSSQPTVRTHITYISPIFAGNFFTNSATWEALTRNQICAPCTGSMESQPLDHQGIPHFLFFICNFIRLLLWKRLNTFKMNPQESLEVGPLSPTISAYIIMLDSTNSSSPGGWIICIPSSTI